MEDACTAGGGGVSGELDDLLEDFTGYLRRERSLAATTIVTLDASAIFHSDRGSNYTSYEFASTITELGMRQSVGRTGISHLTG